MKILIHSNAPWAGSGYGGQTALFAPRLVALGHDVTLSAFYGLGGMVMDWNGIHVLPGGTEPFGNDVVLQHALHTFGDPKGGWLLTLVDVHVLKTDRFERFNVASWVPVDHTPCPENVVTYFTGQPGQVASGAVPIAMSRFGERMLTDAGLAPLYVPHGVDTEMFKPHDRAAARRLPFVRMPEDAFVVGMVAANMAAQPPRKGFGQAFQAFARFARTHDDAILYVHTDKHGDPRGIDLVDLADACGIKDRVRFTDVYMYRRGLDPDVLVALYNSFDVLLNPSYGEGFGIPIIEAQSCGIPVIVTNCTAMPELRGAGWLVEGQPWWNPASKAFFTEPFIDSIVDALERAHTSSPGARAREAREFALGYDADRVTKDYWEPVLNVLAQRIEAVAA